MSVSDECVPCCDYCVHYKDNMRGPEKRGYISGWGICLVDGKDTGAHAHCSYFKCSICGGDDE